MRILIISHEYPPVGGGGANACMNLAREYMVQGNQVTVLTVWYEGLQEFEDAEGVQIIRIRSKRKYLEHCSFVEMFDYLLKASKRVDSIVRQEKVDICQVFFAIPSGPIGYYLKKRYCIPYVIRFGGGDIPGFQKRFKTLYKILEPFEKILWKEADALVANSAGLRQMAIKFYDKCKIDIIPNGASEPAVCFEELQAQNTYRILFVSRLIERKGLQYIIPQLKEIENMCNKGVELVVVGDGPYREALEQLAMDRGVADKVRFCRQKSKEELPKYYCNADVFILPSKKEGMPNVVLEAMSYGLPIIMTPCEGSQELIEENGFVAKVDEFPLRLSQLCNDSSLREKMGSKSKELIQDRFQWSSVAMQYLQLFETIKKK